MSPRQDLFEFHHFYCKTHHGTNEFCHLYNVFALPRRSASIEIMQKPLDVVQNRPWDGGIRQAHYDVSTQIFRVQKDPTWRHCGNWKETEAPLKHILMTSHARWRHPWSIFRYNVINISKYFASETALRFGDTPIAKWTNSLSGPQWFFLFR